jgi:uncharacterized protein YlxW (UPF0749 family)
VLVWLTATAAGLLFATSAATAQGTDLRADRRLQLTELIARERAELRARESAAGELRAEVQSLAELAAAQDDRVAAETAGPALELAAGLVPVEGPAVSVSLDDAPRREGRPSLCANPDDCVVHQEDLQAVVNALWAGGAEGMTLMGERIISTSAVRCVGNTVILHGRVYGPPFVVTAVGEPAALRRSLDRDPGVAFFRTYVDRFGLGYDVRSLALVTLPAYDGPLELPSVQPPAAP